MNINDIVTILMINGSKNYDQDTKEYHILKEVVENDYYLEEMNDLLYNVGYGLYFNETEDLWSVVDII